VFMLSSGFLAVSFFASPAFNTLLFSVLSLLFLAGPIYLFLYNKKKLYLQFLPVLIGALTYLVFGIGMPYLLKLLFFQNGRGVYESLSSNAVLYMLYSGFTVSILIESGRYLTSSIINPYFQHPLSGFCLGFGYAFCYLLVNIILPYAFYAFALISDGANGILAAVYHNDPLALTSLTDYILSIGVTEVLTNAFVCLAWAIMHVGLSILCRYAARDFNNIYYYPLAVIYHAFAAFFPPLYEIGVLTSKLLYCGIEAAFTVLLVLLTLKYFKTAVKLPQSEPFDQNG